MGSGTYGEVRKCKNAKSNVVRAVKILRKEKLDELINRFSKLVATDNGGV